MARSAQSLANCKAKELRRIRMRRMPIWAVVANLNFPRSSGFRGGKLDSVSGSRRVNRS
jgi:hypothetical protein